MAFKGDLESLVLGVLQREPLHGYEIAKRIRETSDALSVGEGQLYPTLHRLEKDGAVVASWIPQEGKPARKVYVLTEKGRGELARRKKAWDEFVLGVSTLLGTASGAESA